MKTIFLTIISGPHTPDILSELAAHSRAAGAEWLVSKFITLDGHFTAMMRVTIDQEKEEALKQSLEAQFAQLSFSNISTPSDQLLPGSTVIMEIDCLDRTGLTRDINELFASRGISIENMESTRHPIGSITSTVYSTRITLSAPKQIDSTELGQQIEAGSPQVKVKIISDETAG
ncbi:MAG: ACT domain-containing protein [Desulfobulbaceae bacterium]|nr:MAG: ACT domain-containing protein [Desulfobulbaceae bacterium]